ncbi:hypothetical protein V2J09_009216 [Rumex salicifolius]
MEKIQHRTVKVNGINMHVAEVAAASETAGIRAPVLFLHGFPELWYSWRHQILAAAAAGYHAIAPDLRGFGDTDAPPSPSSYTAFHVVGDLVDLLDQLGLHQPVFVAGHDWGAIMAYYFALFRPDRVKAMVNLSVPFMPRNPQIKPIQGFKFAFGDDFYICRFQDPDFEEEFANVDIVRWLKQIMGSRNPSPTMIPKGKLRALSDGAPAECPPWLTEEDINYFAEKIKQRGITGGLNYYRAMNMNWELAAAWTGAQIKVPVKFVIGELDLTLNFPGMKDYMSKGGFKRDVPLLDEIVIVEGAAHFVQQEKPEEISNHIITYLNLF